MAKHKIPDRLVPLAEGAAHRGVTAQTIRRRIYDGTITGYRVGPKLLFVDLDEIDSKLIRPVATARAS